MSGQVQQWTLTPYNLCEGLPFVYDDYAVSQGSGTEAFKTGIDTRDVGACVVCGLDDAVLLEHTHIVPQSEPKTWEDLRQRNFIPNQAKTVAHEARNGILLCANHHKCFDNFYFYIRWIPESQRFVLINHSKLRTLKKFHGRAIRLFPGDPRLPFHGAFLIHEMRVRGFWPFAGGHTTISLPIKWQKWTGLKPDDDCGGGDGNNDGNGNDDNDNNHSYNSEDQGIEKSSSLNESMNHIPASQQPIAPGLAMISSCDQIKGITFSGHSLANTPPFKTLTITNPFANPAKLEALKRSFAEQPNWKAAIVEGETWEGTAEENIKKYRGLVEVE